MKDNRNILFILLLILVIIGSRLWAIQSKYVPGFDDIGLQLIISGKGEDIKAQYNKKVKFGKAISSKELKQISQQNQAWNLAGVTNLIKGKENHPPLFFWMAHLWCSIFGFSFAALYSLQALIEIMLVMALFSLIKKISPNSVIVIAISIAVLLVHPSTIDSFICPRNYHLLALFTVLLFRLFFANSPTQSIWIIPIVFAGTLTHFYFPVIVFALVLAFVISQRFTKAFIIKLLFVLVGFLLAFVLFKSYFVRLFDSANSSPSLTSANHSGWLMAAAAPLRLFIPWRLIREIPIALASLIWPMVFILLIPFISRQRSKNRVAIAFGLILLFTLAILLVLGKVPFHTFTENRYLLIVTCLFIPFSALQLFKFKKIRRPFLLPSLLFFYFACLSALYFMHRNAEAIEHEKIVLIGKYNIDVYQAAYAVEEDQKIYHLKTHEGLNDLPLENALILWKRFDPKNPEHIKTRNDLGLQKTTHHYYINSFEKRAH